MNLEALALRLYGNGFRDHDFTAGVIKDNELIVRSIKAPDKSIGGLIVSPAAQKLPGTAAYVFEVLAKGFIDTDPDSYRRCPSPVAPLDPDVGDVVVLRTAHLEPLDASLNIHAIKAEHVLSILPHDADSFDDTQPEAHIALVKPEHMAEVIPFRKLHTITLPRNDQEAA